MTSRTPGRSRRGRRSATSPVRRRVRGIAALLVAIGAFTFAAYVSFGSTAFRRPTLVAVLLVVTALVGLWQAKTVLR